MPISERNETPNASRLHIAVFGRRNAGKSSLVNALTNTNAALVSEIPGTTTDPVYKAIEIYPIGPAVLIDTAGIDDTGTLGEMRVSATKEMIDKTDLALVVFAADEEDTSKEEDLINELKEYKKPIIAVINKSDISNKIPDIASKLPYVLISASQKNGMDELRAAIVRAAPGDFELPSIAGHLISPGDHVLLVAPQDLQAPKGRLILPQVQTIRDLLDSRAVVTVVTTEELDRALKLFSAPPKLIITDSQVFSHVHERCPEGTMLTSFSVLFARYKGDIAEYLEGAKTIDRLKESDAVLILEACAHNPLDGDIGRVKIPALLRKKVGNGLTVDVVGGNRLPEDLKKYALAVQCGGCMTNRAFLLARIKRLKENGIPVTNYGILIAKMTGILDKITV